MHTQAYFFFKCFWEIQSQIRLINWQIPVLLLLFIYAHVDWCIHIRTTYAVNAPCLSVLGWFEGFTTVDYWHINSSDRKDQIILLADNIINWLIDCFMSHFTQTYTYSIHCISRQALFQILQQKTVCLSILLKRLWNDHGPYA